MSIILPASLLTFIHDNKSLISVYMNSNDGVHKLVQLQFKSTACIFVGNGERIWHIDNVFICFLGKTGEM